MKQVLVHDKENFLTVQPQKELVVLSHWEQFAHLHSFTALLPHSCILMESLLGYPRGKLCSESINSEIKQIWAFVLGPDI